MNHYMKIVKKAVLMTIPVFLLAITFFMVQRTRNPVCESPFILFTQSKANQPKAIVSNLIAKLGGLPKPDMDVYRAIQFHDVPPIYPVKEWHVVAFSTANSRFNKLFDDDPIYSHEFTLQVRYVDGDTTVLHWSSWSYGIVACPLLISLGSGPPGQLKVIP